MDFLCELTVFIAELFFLFLFLFMVLSNVQKKTMQFQNVENQIIVTLLNL